jgi:hypothetical protein
MMRLTKLNPETGRYEYIAKPMEYVEYRALTLAALQKLGEYEYSDERKCRTCAYIGNDREEKPCSLCWRASRWQWNEEEEEYAKNLAAGYIDKGILNVVENIDLFASLLIDTLLMMNDHTENHLSFSQVIDAISLECEAFHIALEEKMKGECDEQR